MEIFVVAAIDVQTGSVYPAKFPDEGPDVNFRSAVIFGGNAKVQFSPPFSYKLLVFEKNYLLK